MRIVGLVTEYNPFHNGHLYHLKKALALTGAEGSVAVMSGHFLQRGEPALLDKWSRAEMAVRAGVDLVLELPYAFSCRSAGAFAKGSVALLNNTGLVTDLCFGTEVGEIQPLQKLAQLFVNEPISLKTLIKKHLKAGLILPLAQSRALEEYLQLQDIADQDLELSVLNNPNNILGIEYIRSLIELKSRINPVTVKRKSAGYHDTTFAGSFASATSIREFLASLRAAAANGACSSRYSSLREVLPATSLSILLERLKDGRGPVFLDNFLTLFLYKLRTTPIKELTEILDINEGLENRISDLAGQATSLRGLAEKVKTKRYTWTRIQRVMNYILMSYPQEQAARFDLAGPQYIRLLGATQKGREMVAMMRKRASLPVITKVAPFYKSASGIPKEMLELDLRATDIYALGCPNPNYYNKGTDFLTGPFLLDK